MFVILQQIHANDIRRIAVFYVSETDIVILILHINNYFEYNYSFYTLFFQPICGYHSSMMVIKVLHPRSWSIHVLSFAHQI